MGFGDVEAVGHDRGATGGEELGVGGEGGSEHEREIGAAEEASGEPALGRGRMRVEPLAETGGVPVEDERGEKRPAEQHHDEIAVERTALAGGGHVIKGHRAVARAEREGAETRGEQGDEFRGTPAADVGGVAGKARVDVMQFQRRLGGGEVLDEGLHHEALAVDGRRRVRENEK